MYIVFCIRELNAERETEIKSQFGVLLVCFWCSVLLAFGQWRGWMILFAIWKLVAVGRKATNLGEREREEKGV